MGDIVISYSCSLSLSNKKVNIFLINVYIYICKYIVDL